MIVKRIQIFELPLSNVEVVVAIQNQRKRINKQALVSMKMKG